VKKKEFNFLRRFATVNFIHPLTRLVHQGFGVLGLCENFRFKSWHLAGGSCRFNHKNDQKLLIKGFRKALSTDKRTA